MTDEQEKAYTQGSRAAWQSMLSLCLRELGFGKDDPAVEVARLVFEREATVVALRSVCAEHGDNDWDESLHLADVVEKHLADHLG